MAGLLGGHFGSCVRLFSVVACTRYVFALLLTSTTTPGGGHMFLWVIVLSLLGGTL